ncbi:DUF3164 family protein [Hydrogenovibrio sp. 3SP14C1]|uniref:DUF3164 family protein n=1 Tax=Hydrogenovibrio sp. 3SP14C1 TaxID=3038774 RepID=UPI00241705D1|nr:DUF3164 family protein [Hydrogenovibrio sp. 3SP14C1]MDG4811682.1 DUF3164 family protein [Hydrogenovibrio sp. 3SP14C1]
MTQQNSIPEGYMKDTSGRLVPTNLVSDIDKQRDELVQEIIGHAQEVNKAIGNFKSKTFGDIEAFIDLSAEKYNVKMGGQKGNVTLMSYDGRYKVQRAISENLVFDERLQVAKELIDECIHKWTQGTNDNIRALVEHAFQTDKEGKINTARIFSLLKLEIKDAGWQNAMEAIKDSIQVAGSKSYIRIYERIGASENYKAIPLDIAAV